MRIDRWLQLKRTKAFCVGLAIIFAAEQVVWGADSSAFRAWQLSGEQAGRTRWLVERQMVKSNSSFLDDSDRVTQVNARADVQQRAESLLDGLSGGIAESNEDDTRFLGQEGRKQMREVKIHGQHNTSLPLRVAKDFFIRSLGQADIARMNRIMPRSAKPHRCAWRQGHVEEKLHARSVGGGEGEGFFAGQPRCVFQGFLDIFGSQVGIVPKDFLCRLAGCQQIENQVNWNSQAPNARLSCELLGINRNPWETFHVISIAFKLQTCQT